METVSLVIAISVSLQVVAGLLALWLIPLSGRALAWILLSSAFWLMAGRRLISLLYNKGYLDESVHAIVAESTALAISILIASGVFMIRRIFTERREQHYQLHRQARHDALTGLPNRVHLIEKITALLTDRIRRQQTHALLLMDLDRFKEINDTLGHQVGDQLLQALAERLRNVLIHDRDFLLARLGGDEFCLFMTDTTASAAQAMGQYLQASLAEPIACGDHRFHMRASMGIALYPAHGNDADSLLQHAETAMYLAKQHDKGIGVYEPVHDPNTAERLALINDLREATDRQELTLYYQPIIHAAHGRPVAVEALLRWEHPQRGIVMPDTLIPLAEYTGLITPITEWVLESAVQQCRTWRANGIQSRVNINLSARNLDDPELPDRLVRLLDRWGVTTDCLMLEITESAVMAHGSHGHSVLRRLHAYGIKIAVDDFGTGYSSLSHLRELPLSQLKIDKSFVLDMEQDENDAVIVRSMIDLAHNLGLRVVAEGVENQEISNLLSMLGCDLLQGYHFSRPMPAAEFEQWLSRQVR